MFLRNKNNSAKFVVLFEVSSGSVAGAIVSSHPDSQYPIVHYSDREFLSLKQTDAVENLTKRLVGIFLTNAIKIESKLASILPHSEEKIDVYINFTAPWAQSYSNTHIYESGENFLITNKLLHDIQLTEVKNEKSNKFNPVTKLEKKLTIINKVTTGYFVNGYAISNPIGKKAKKIVATEAVSVIDSTIFNPIQDTIKKLFVSSNKTLFLTSSLIHQNILQTISEIPSTFAIIHITHEAFEMTLFQESEIINSFNVPVGINTMARNIAKTTRLPHEQVLSYLTTNDKKVYQKTVQNKMEKAINTKISPILIEFFNKIQKTELIPRDFYIVTTPRSCTLVTDAIKGALKESIHKKFVIHRFEALNTQNVNSTYEDHSIGALIYFFHNNLLDY